MILFITRKHPPSIGGMQKLSQSLTVEVGRLAPTATISWGRGTVGLPWFLSYAVYKSFRIIRSNPQIEVIHLSDALLAPFGVLLKRLFRLPVVVTVHGLDITFPEPNYQRTVPAALRKLDRLVCVSSATRDQCVRRGIPAALCEVIPNGVTLAEFEQPPRPEGLAEVRALAGDRLEGRKVLLTVGRLVERKGVVFFLDYILPRVLARDPDVCYLIVGEGPQREVIETRIASRHLDDHVALVGQVSDAGLKAAYHLADLFVMPNQPVPNDMEGFGIVALDAGATRRPVIASNIDGIPEAIVPGENGCLLDPTDADAWIRTIRQMLHDDAGRQAAGDRAHEYVAEHYSWDRIAERYARMFLEVAADARRQRAA
jgi:glycosyltransferase involved in cell wall biosynthesis